MGEPKLLEEFLIQDRCESFFHKESEDLGSKHEICPQKDRDMGT